MTAAHRCYSTRSDTGSTWGNSIAGRPPRASQHSSIGVQISRTAGFSGAARAHSGSRHANTST